MANATSSIFLATLRKTSDIFTVEAGKNINKITCAKRSTMFSKCLTGVTLTGILLLGSVPLSFADNNDSHAGFNEKNSADTMTPATMDGGAPAEYKQAMDKMNKGMMSGMASDPSKSWAQMMVEHHQGAIDMSKIVLKNTQDPAIKQMAEKNIEEQRKSIAELKSWLSKH